MMSNTVGRGDECDDCCVHSCMNIFGCLCCYRRLRKAARIKILWGWLLGSGIISCVLLGCVIYGPETPYVTPSDMRPVTDHINFLFCEAAYISSPDPLFSAYVVDGDLQIDPDNRELINSEMAFGVDTNDFDFVALYLLPGSHLEIELCSRGPATFYIIKGDDDFSKWKRDSTCEDCYVQKVYLTTQPDSCMDDNDGDKVTLDVDIEDEYYIIYSNPVEPFVWIDVELSISKTVYDLSNAQSLCTEVRNCQVNINNPNQVAVYKVGYDVKHVNLSYSTFTTKCIPRIWSYLLIHGLSILILGMSCSVMIQKLSRDPISSQLSYSGRANERTPLLYGAGLPPSYTTATLEPPKYEDIIRGIAPPSYSDVISVPASTEESGQASLRPGSVNSFYTPPVSNSWSSSNFADPENTSVIYFEASIEWTNEESSDHSDNDRVNVQSEIISSECNNNDRGNVQTEHISSAENTLSETSRESASSIVCMADEHKHSQTREHESRAVLQESVIRPEVRAMNRNTNTEPT